MYVYLLIEESSHMKAAEQYFTRRRNIFEKERVVYAEPFWGNRPQIRLEVS